MEIVPITYEFCLNKVKELKHSLSLIEKLKRTTEKFRLEFSEEYLDDEEKQMQVELKGTLQSSYVQQSTLESLVKGWEGKAEKLKLTQLN